MHRVLAVHPDADVLDLMAGVLDEKYPDLILVPVRNAAHAADQCRAQNELEEPFRLIVVFYSIAQDFRTPRNERENRGLDFLESLAQLGHADVPKILIAPSVTNELLSRMDHVPHCRLLLIDKPETFEQAFVDAVGNAVQHTEDEVDSEAESKQVKVVLSLNLERQSWEYQLKCVGFEYSKPAGSLQVDPRSLARLVSRSQRFGRNVNNGDWERELLEIGQDFGMMLLRGNPQFSNELQYAQGRAGGREKKSICFNIEKSVHPAALEALTDPEEESFWMLQVPMYRRLIRSGQSALERSALFSDRARRAEQFTALIIESPTEGVVDKLTDPDGQPLQLPSLEFVTEEASRVEALLRGKARQLRRLCPTDTPTGKSFRNYVQDVLRSEQWDLVHYVGHCHYDEAAGKGYLLFPNEYAEPLDVEIFNTWLEHARTRFLYMSGCKSSEAGFVFELARLQIPGILGFRWPIDDKAALDFASTFYEQLFQNDSRPCLERAFTATRRGIRELHKEDRIWAAAMLMLQDPD